ncbi:leukocyte cell-derived chemotaxin-2-like [Oncorhynchus masou masou]|uniref:leukocyte cell-derived chemotaxin-2-like n=1 Tax=Oncorhynchus masou masou TaxID=90313 RepID=UPI003183E088
MAKFGQLCNENSSNRRRAADNWGQGQYRASRTDHVHEGIVCNDGATVYAPFDVKLSGKVTVYTNPKKAAINDGINLSGEGLCFKLFYMKPDNYSGVVKKGQRIGTLLPMQSVYPGITSHVHVQMCDKSDPTKYI